MKLLIGLAAILFCTSIQLEAGVLYDETVSGDIAGVNTSNATYLGVLAMPQNEVLGSLSAVNIGQQFGPDEYDYFSFTANAQFTVDLSSLTLDGTSSQLTYIYNASGDIVDFRGDSFATSDLFGVLNAGDYTIGLLPAGNDGNVTYAYTINVDTNSDVPEPTSLAIFGLGVIGLAGGAIRRRKKQQT